WLASLFCFQAEDGIRDFHVTGVQTCALPISAQGNTVLVVACDMPFVNRLLLEHLLNLAPEADVVVPRWNDTYQTMQTVYARKPRSEERRVGRECRLGGLPGAAKDTGMESGRP